MKTESQWTTAHGSTTPSRVFGRWITALLIGATAMAGAGQSETYKPRAIPSGADAYSTAQFAAERSDWLKRRTLERFEKSGEHDPAWDAEAKAFLEGCTGLYNDEGKFDQSVIAAGNRLKEAGCRHPIVQYWQNRIVLHQYWMGMNGVAEALIESKADPFHAFMACSDVLRTQGREKDRDFLTLWSGRAELAWVEAAGEARRAELRHLYAMLDQYSGIAPKGMWGRLQERIVELKVGLHPWLSALLEGRAEIERGWKARGTDIAANLKEKQWEGFAEHLGKAREALIRAHELHPDRPEAATAMITVAMGIIFGEMETRFWFDQAVAAQMDYEPAYYALIHALRPRWGGSNAAMASFGEECLMTGRFDTQVPFYYLMAMRGIADDEPEMGNWRSVYRAPGVYEKLVAMLDGYRRAGVDPVLLDYQLSVIEGWCGHYSRASQIYENLPADLDPRASLMGLAIGYRKLDPAEVRAEFRAFTGKAADKSKQAESAEMAGKLNEAVKLYEEAIGAAAGDAEVVRYLKLRQLEPRMRADREESRRWTEANNATIITIDPDAVIKGHLIAAAATGDLGEVKRLLEEGIDVDEIERDDEKISGASPVVAAIQRGNEMIVNYLVDRGARMNANYSDRVSPLMHALVKCREVTIRNMLEHGADVNHISHARTTPLHVAVARGDAALVKLLLEKGARIEALTQGGWNGVKMVFRKQQREVALLFPEFRPRNTQPQTMDTVPLMQANGDRKGVLALLDQDAKWLEYTANRDPAENASAAK